MISGVALSLQGMGKKAPEILEEFVDMEQSMGNVKISGGPNAKVSDPISRKRSRESHVNLESNIVELDASTTTSERMLNHDGRTWKSCKSYNTLVSQSNCNSGSGFVELSSASSSASVCNNEATHSPEEPAMWDCEACTFLNHPLIPICEVCSTPRPKDPSTKSKIWTCKFCTLENCMKLDKCSVCDQWRYSRGSPVSTRTPYLGT
ncbi:DNA-dependent metalloprotease WSS1-like [Melia azedarach]|uniref:DNA-dependent metalloprotease WSS1-like n=1 Tax=Melia azedarach TaxID=155640 RepID=A0ACC1YRN5_MELAZ|nr:DNA-dependent metalloprotease WSS1-like [Melia azedarach]